MQSDAQLPVGWDTVRLESLATEGSVTYGVVQPGQAAPDGIPMIRVNNFRGFGLDTSDVLRIGPEVEAKYGRTRLKSDDVLITIVGTVGQVAMVPPALEGWNIARAVAVIRPKEAKFARWIALALRAPESQRALGVAANTTVQTTINLKDLRQLLVPIPPTEERQAIEQLLCSLDDRIDLLRQTNATLESIAQALFKSWFIDFDPVRAKQANHEPEGMDAATAALFPAEFEESALGLIPKGWRVLPFLEVCDLLGGAQPPASSFVDSPRDGYVRLLQIRDFSTDAHLTYVPESSRLKTASEDDVLIGRYGSASGDKAKDSLGRVCRGLAGAYNVALMKLRPQEVGREFALQLVNVPSFYEYLQGVSAKAVQSGFSKSELGNLRVVVPPRELVDVYEDFGLSVWHRVKENRSQAKVLESLRDTLLPRLISGKLRLPEARQQPEDAPA